MVVCRRHQLTRFAVTTHLFDGIEVGRSMAWADAVMAIYLGSIILAAIGGIAATLGVRYRLTSYALIHLSFGGNAARLVNLAFGLSLVGWFGVNVDLFSEAVLDLIQPRKPVLP